jgi:hypothetical protein
MNKNNILINLSESDRTKFGKEGFLNAIARWRDTPSRRLDRE